VPGLCYGESSIFKIVLGEPAVEALQRGDTEKLMTSGRSEAAGLRKAMLLEGVDLMGSSGFLSIAHDDGDVERSVEAFVRALARLQDEGIVS
jgi:hypothetical protein